MSLVGTMKALRRHLLLVGGLIGFLPLLSQAVLAWSGTPQSPVPWYVLYGSSAATVLLLVHWSWDVRAKEIEASTVSSVLPWVATGAGVLVAAMAFSFVSGYSEVELFPGERYFLPATAVVTVVVSGLQGIVAVVMIVLDHREDGVPGSGPALSLGLAVLLVFSAGAGAVAEDVVRSPRPAAEHLTTEAEHPALEIPAVVEDIDRTLDLPDGSVIGLQAVASGVLLKLDDGVMVVDPVTGNELWRYRLPGSVTRSVITPDMGSIVMEAYMPSRDDDPSPDTVRVTLDAGTGRILHRTQDGQRLLKSEMSPDSHDADAAEPLDGESVVVRNEEDVPLEVYGASSGALLWSLADSSECTLDESASNIVMDREVTGDHVFVQVSCFEGSGDSRRRVPRVFAFASVTGELMWTHEIPADDYLGGEVTASTDGSLLYVLVAYWEDRVDGSPRRYSTLDAETGEEVASGDWGDIRPSREPGEGELWKSVLGNGALLGSDPALTLTDAYGSPEHTRELPSTDGNRRIATTDEVLYSVEWPESGDRSIDLTVYPWDGSTPHTIEDVLDRPLPEGEVAGIRVVPGAVVVYSVESNLVTSAVTVR